MESNFNLPSENFEQLSADLNRLSADCRNNPETRAELDADPREFFAKRGLPLLGESEVQVVYNTPEVVYLPLPPDPNEAMSDEVLAEVTGGVQAGSLFSIFLSCFSTMAPDD